MPDEPGPFELPDGADDSGFDDEHGLSITFDDDGHMTPTITVPQGDLEPAEQWPQPSQGAGGTTPFDPEHSSVDRAIWNANHPEAEAQLPYNPSDPLHLGLLPAEHIVDSDPMDYGPGDYPVPADDPVVADTDYGTDDTAAWDAFA
jgi:hypothetical protein